MVAIGYLAGQDSASSTLRGVALDTIQEGLDQQSIGLEALQHETELTLQALTVNLAELQARMTRLDALGEHLTAVADIGDGEFDFSQPPAVGGPLAGEYSVDFNAVNLTGEVDRFEARLDDREQQLGVLESLLGNRKLAQETLLSGQPLERGWITSGYGTRTDPFTGRKSMHTGIDFTGRAGSEVLAVAAGVVTWTGRESNYGNLVEISHGDGYVTRYAHNKQNLVAAGDLVRKGEPIALMGATGRASGPHVHYEVYKHGRPVDPSSYVRRTRR